MTFDPRQIECGPVLITGGAGFLGRHLAARLAGAGQQVTVLDDLSCANSTFDCAALASDRISRIKGSAFDRPLVDDLVSRHRSIVHFASIVGVEETVSHTVATIDGLNATLNVVRALTRDHLVLFGSSADVYGAHSRLYDRAMREDDMLVFEGGRVNRWVYPHVKALEENLFSNCAARTVITRIFNTYGPELDYPTPKRVIAHFIDCILAGRPLLLSGDGTQQRSFCFVDDAIDGFIRALDHASRMDAPRSDCFNIGHPEPVSIRELARIILDCAQELGIIDTRLPILVNRFVYSQGFDDTWHRTPDIDRARRALGFVPTVSLRDGLTRTLAYHDGLRKNAPAQGAAEGLALESGFDSARGGNAFIRSA